MSKKLQFKDVVDRTARKTHYYRYNIKPILEGFFEVVVEALRAGEEINIQGFGSFYIYDMPETVVKSNFTDSQEKIVPAHKTYKFRFGERLRNNLDELEDSADE